MHLSDPHLPQTETESNNGIIHFERLDDTIRSILNLEIQPKFALITGDLSDRGSLQGYRLLKQRTDELEVQGIPVLFALGNNDRRDRFRDVFVPGSGSGLLFYSQILDGIRVVVLDSVQPGLREGHFSGNQIGWLHEELRSDPEFPTVIAFHHPINEHFFYMLDGMEYNRDQKRSFYEAISGCNVLGVLSGHLHHNQSTVVNGVLHSQAGSVSTEISYDEETYWVRNRSSYNHLFYRNGQLYIKTIMMPYDGRVLTSGSVKTLLGLA